MHGETLVLLQLEAGSWAQALWNVNKDQPRGRCDFSARSMSCNNAHSNLIKELVLKVCFLQNWRPRHCKVCVSADLDLPLLQHLFCSPRSNLLLHNGRWCTNYGAPFPRCHVPGQAEGPNACQLRRESEWVMYSKNWQCLWQWRVGALLVGEYENDTLDVRQYIALVSEKNWVTPPS